MSVTLAPVTAALRTLPSGWSWTALGDICDIVIGRTPRRDSLEYWSGSLPWVTISDLNDGVVTDTRERITTLGAEASGARLLASGTLLFSFKLTIGKMAFAGVDLYTNEAIAGLVPRVGVQLSTEYLRYALSAVNVSSGSSHAVKGRTLNLPVLRAIKIPLPPLPEQKRIAAALREQLDAVARMRAAVENQLETARTLAQRQLDTFFRGAQADDWPLIPLPEVADVVAGVTLGRRLDVSSARPVAYLRVANVKDGHLDLSDLAETLATEPEIGRLRLESGDVLLTEGGDPDKLGRGTVWREEAAECIHQNHIFRARLDPRRANPIFVSAQMGSAYGKQYFARHAKQTTGIASINQRVLKAFPLRLPPLPVQEAIAREHEDLVLKQRRLETSADNALAAAYSLPHALLSRAFSEAP